MGISPYHRLTMDSLQVKTGVTAGASTSRPWESDICDCKSCYHHPPRACTTKRTYDSWWKDKNDDEVKTERITCWGHCFWFPCLGEQQVRAASIESVLCTLYILQTNVSEDCMVTSVSSPMPKFFSKPWHVLFEDLP